MTTRLFGVSLALFGFSLLGGCAMEVQAQQEVERETACDVVYANSEPAPSISVVKRFYADVGDESVRSVRAELLGRTQSDDYQESSLDNYSSRITTEAIRRDGRTLVLCGTQSTQYDADQNVVSDRYRVFQQVRFVRSDRL